MLLKKKEKKMKTVFALQIECLMLLIFVFSGFLIEMIFSVNFLNVFLTLHALAKCNCNTNMKIMELACFFSVELLCVFV